MESQKVLDKITEAIADVCDKAGFQKLRRLRVIVPEDSPLREKQLEEHLKASMGIRVGEWTEILLDKQEIAPMKAVIADIQGE